ncbi:MAG: (2Fe-2S)-binding protein [Acidimicrobiales bacterium]
MTIRLEEVLAAVRARVDHLRATCEDPLRAEAGWHECDAIGPEDLAAAIDEGASHTARDRTVAASLLVQSYAYRVAAVSLAAFALGLPWPSPAAAATSVRVSDGRATALRFRSTTLGEAEDAQGIAEAAFASHLVGFVSAARASQRLGERLAWANVAASSAAAFRAVEGSARDRGDAGERLAIRRRADQLLAHTPWLAGTGWFDTHGPAWRWERSACCLWYRTSGGRTCEGCSLRSRQEVHA